jgi:hypothetical protein
MLSLASGAPCRAGLPTGDRDAHGGWSEVGASGPCTKGPLRSERLSGFSRRYSLVLSWENINVNAWVVLRPNLLDQYEMRRMYSSVLDQSELRTAQRVLPRPWRWLVTAMRAMGERELARLTLLWEV